MKNFKTVITPTVLSAIAGLHAQAQQPWPVPRGPGIEAMASACRIGSIPQTSKAGPYNIYCEELTDAEKCLALVKGHMNSKGVLRPAYEQKKVPVCLEVFERELTKIE